MTYEQFASFMEKYEKKLEKAEAREEKDLQDMPQAEEDDAAVPTTMPTQLTSAKWQEKYLEEKAGRSLTKEEAQLQAMDDKLANGSTAKKLLDHLVARKYRRLARKEGGPDKVNIGLKGGGGGSGGEWASTRLNQAIIDHNRTGENRIKPAGCFKTFKKAVKLWMVDVKNDMMKDGMEFKGEQPGNATSRIEEGAVILMQVAMEDFGKRLLEDAYLITGNRNAKTLQPKDLDLCARLQGHELPKSNAEPDYTSQEDNDDDDNDNNKGKGKAKGSGK
jgi:histone H3/H4